ncbi:DNA-directed RNA polymerase subunit beta' [Candidatus Parcubacteria bacterium]|nr:DNA-directed RNA polymerase subunit beta' [Patescibacteria group bacterium]MCG2689112.1 DNA-directed RNA polymerase subunit beta' [Candidatus Parcubacteria bacterium]
MNKLSRLKDFHSLKISVASPDDIQNWSFGEITKPETINYRTFKAEKGGLFDEKIFGPTKDYECYCGKYKRIRYKGVICDKCGVEVTHSRVRRERMGHITLASPVAHVWFFKGIPSKLALLLDISPRSLEAVIYFSSYIVISLDSDKKMSIISTLSKDLELEKSKVLEDSEAQIALLKAEVAKEVKEKDKQKKALLIEAITLKANQKVAQIREKVVARQDEVKDKFSILDKKLSSIKRFTVLTDMEYLDMAYYMDQFCTVEIGAEAIKNILDAIDLVEDIKKLKAKITRTKGQAQLKLTKRLKVLEGFRHAGISPTWVVLQHLPVIPPDLRPMVQLEGGRFATSDLNDLYRRIINRNSRLKRLLNLGAPEIIVRNEKRMLQEAVDALIDSSKQRSTSRVLRTTRKPLRSISDMLKGKQGRFRQNLLGKRVDYSGRSVIVVGPELALTECGIPREMAIELLKPLVLREILLRGLAPNVKSAKYILEERGGEVWDIVESLAKTRPVLLNRAPTLHRLGIQAFYPKLIDGNAIQIHPCVCDGYNADFDGDQMAVHLPLSKEAIDEAKDLMLADKNLLKPSNGQFIAMPAKDMILGVYYLTTIDTEAKKHSGTFGSVDEVLLALDNKKITLKQLINVYINGKTLETTAGRVIFNEQIPQSLGYINSSVGKSASEDTLSLSDLFDKVLKSEDSRITVEFIDAVKNLGYEYATKSGLSVSLFDFKASPDKDLMLNVANKKAEEIDLNYKRGLITRQEQKSLLQALWQETTEKIDDATWKMLDDKNVVKYMLKSGGAGKASRVQIRQIAGMRGLIADPTGRIIEMPIKGNYKEGLSGFEYFAGSRGSRKGITDKSLRTADAGYLTRRLVDVAQDVIIRTEFCGTEKYREISRADCVPLASMADKLKGRFVAKTVKHKGKTLIKKGELITASIAKQIDLLEIDNIRIYSPLTCEYSHGICQKCYGEDLTNLAVVKIGVPVGILAAQSIGEPGTQLTMRTFHTGGVAGKDITQGLPRVEEILEARLPKSLSIMSEISGRVSLEEDKNGKRTLTVKVTTKNVDISEVCYNVDPVSEIIVAKGDLVTAGQPLTLGSLDLGELLNAVGVMQTQNYIVKDLQKVYTSQGVKLNDKHLEVIVRQMFNKVEVDKVGDTIFLQGEVITKDRFEEENSKVAAEGGEMAEGHLILLGITRSSLETDSFLAAASFMNTSRVLTDAASVGAVDKLLGLKENVIIGRLIPVGERARLE